jgi:hypothetical protein
MRWACFSTFFLVFCTGNALSAEQPPAPRELNNLVSELLSRDKLPDETEARFINPREGWVFFGVEAQDMALCETETILYLDESEEALVWRRNPDTNALEAMIHLEEGTHRLRLNSPAGARLVVRAVPELMYCYYPTKPHIAPFGPYDWGYMERHVFPHVNTLVTRSTVDPGEFAQWLREGRRWIANAGLPGLGSDIPPTADEVFEVWSQNPGVTAPGFAGIIVDEFLGDSRTHYAAWDEAIGRLHALPTFAGRTFYAWCVNLYQHRPANDFRRNIQAGGDRFVWEVYLPEEATEEEARRRLLRSLRDPMNQWRKSQPGFEKHLVMCLGYLSAPPETLNVEPLADYHVFLDMQFRILATDSAFKGLYGIMEYMADYADEESLRYAHKLFRHYGIEGQRVPFSRDPYRLRHLQNPDFAKGHDGWHAIPAEAGAIEADSMEGFSWLQGRYPRTRSGDTFAVLTRSTAEPNRLEQNMEALQAGRLYSVKFITADLDDLHREQTTHVEAAIEGGELLDEFSIQSAYPSCYSHESGPYTRETPAWFTFHRTVFRATAATARLSLANGPGPSGQRIALNFVEVQPFHAP